MTSMEEQSRCFYLDSEFQPASDGGEIGGPIISMTWFSKLLPIVSQVY